MAGFYRRIEIVDHDLGLRGIIELVLDPVVTRDAIALSNVEAALTERDSVWGVEAFENRLDLALTTTIDDRVHVLCEAIAHEHRALVAERERACLGNAIGPHFHLESRR